MNMTKLFKYLIVLSILTVFSTGCRYFPFDNKQPVYYGHPQGPYFNLEESIRKEYQSQGINYVEISNYSSGLEVILYTNQKISKSAYTIMSESIAEKIRQEKEIKGQVKIVVAQEGNPKDIKHSGMF